VWKGRLLIIAAAIIAYLPAIDNGFIADDYVILHRLDLLKVDPFYLHSVVPENFRLTTYIVFAALRGLFGYQAWAFYVFNMILHAVNCLLLCRIVRDVSQNSIVAVWSGVFFAVFQAPQEAVMWLAAMNETLCAFFLFVTFLLWFSGRYTLAAISFFAALFSKEMAALFVVLLPLIQWYRGRRVPLETYLALGAPAALFASVFVWTWKGNFQVEQGTYAPGLHAALVLFKSLHRLFWPWGYVTAISVWWTARQKIDRRALAWAALIPITMLPYIFVTYTNNIPSRQVYLSSAIFLPLLVSGLFELRSMAYRNVLVCAFVVFNILYMWTVKDRQMVRRAVPTTELREELARHSPTTVRIRGFEYPIANMASAVALTVPGWRYDEVRLAESCKRCLFLEWDREALKYHATAVP
jgi:hypothetical protein